MTENSPAISGMPLSGLSITIICDNKAYDDNLQAAWGFSSLVTGPEKTILFDTGPDKSVLFNNMKKLAIEPNSIDTVVLSHIHGDHTTGLASLLQNNTDITVYLLKSFPKKFKTGSSAHAERVVEVEKPLEICENVYSTGTLGTVFKEQSLIMRTEAGLVVITGCAHPGVVNIIRTAKKLFVDDIFLLLGGFHLEWASKSKIEKTILALEQEHVRFLAPCHCTSEKAKACFASHFREHYLDVGAGKKIILNQLQQS